MLTRLKSFIRAFNYYTCMVGMFFLLALMLLTTCDVIMRALFGKPIPGTFELSEYLLSISILLGAAYTQQIKGHVGVDFVLKRLGPKALAISEAVTGLLCLIIIGLLAWQGLLRAMEESTVSDMLRIPQAPFRFLVFVAGIGLFWEFLVDVIQSLTKCFGAKDEPG